MTLKAIETVYNGYRFRSRLEARWAVFFDALGEKYEYEPQGYDLDGLLYLPDFWLPRQQCWVEIKGGEVDDESEEKAGRLAQLSSKPVFVFAGSIGVPVVTAAEPGGFNVDGSSAKGFLHDEKRGWKVYWGYVWHECFRCKAHQLEWFTDDIGGKPPCSCLWASDDLASSYDTPFLKRAYDAARQARFEHGEQPQRQEAISQKPPQRIVNIRYKVHCIRCEKNFYTENPDAEHCPACAHLRGGRP